MKFRRSILALGTVLMLIATACSSNDNPIFGQPDGGDGSPFGLPGGETTTPGSGGSSGGTSAPGSTSPPDSGIPGLGTDVYRPLPMREGLGTFNNYVWHMELTTVGPTADESLAVATDWSFNSDPESNYTKVTSTQTGPDFETPETTTQEVFAVGGEGCQFDGEDWTYTGASDQQQEVLDVIERLFDVTIVPESPVEIGQEAVAGISATHYSYAVSGFGSDSGALVTANQVDYWVANDTRVLLKYTMVVESRSGPESDPAAEVYRLEAAAELVSADVFTPIDLPAECLAEKAASEA